MSRENMAEFSVYCRSKSSALENYKSSNLMTAACQEIIQSHTEDLLFTI